MRSEPYFYLLGLPIGPPQFLAGLLLLCFLGQCAWLLVNQPTAMTPAALHAERGLLIEARGPVVGRLAEVPVLLGEKAGVAWPYLLWLARLPFILAGLFLGASTWYVARRLYGNPGGIAAMVLYCFSPTPFVATHPGPMPVAALGMFGVVFISIAVSHTLYAPPRASLWGEIGQRWRRLAILAIALVLMIGAAPELSFMILVALGMMFYLVPHRRGAALALMVSALAVAGAVLLALGGPRWFTRADFSPFSGWFSPRYVIYTSLRAASWTVTTIAAAAAAVYLTSSRSRYFGNTAPLLATGLTLVLGLPTMGHAYLGAFPAWSLPLLFVFVGGIFADLAETSWRRPALIVFVVLAASLATLELLAVARNPWPGPPQLSPPQRVERIRIGAGAPI